MFEFGNESRSSDVMSKFDANSCKRLIEIKDQLEENADLVEAIISRDDVEDLLVALGMAAAYSEGVITLNKTGEQHLMSSLVELLQIYEEFQDVDE